MKRVEDLRERVIKEIATKRVEILDNFMRAYLAENLKDSKIRDLYLTEQRTKDGYRWWFENKRWISNEVKEIEGYLKSREKLPFRARLSLAWRIIWGSNAR